MNQTDAMKDLDERTAKAVAHYWQTRAAQKAENSDLFTTSKLPFEKAVAEPACLREESALCEIRPRKNGGNKPLNAFNFFCWIPMTAR